MTTGLLRLLCEACRGPPGLRSAAAALRLALNGPDLADECLRVRCAELTEELHSVSPRRR